MKNFAVVFIVVVLAVTSLAFAADPPYRNRDRNRGQICAAVLAGEIVTLNGIVANMGYKQKMVVATTEGDLEKIYSIGPNWYWRANDVDKPEVSDVVTVTAFAVPFTDGIHYIAASITIVGGGSLQLRDLETGCPLWRRTGQP